MKMEAHPAPAPDSPRRRSGGRPSQAEALKRDERLVEIAAAMFMERGFDATTIDAVAEAASVGKATVYARYRDKAELFAAVLRRQIDRWFPRDEPAVPTDARLDDVLLDIARRMLATALTPEAVAISRIIMSQAVRFPDLARLVHTEGSQRKVASLSELLRVYAAKGEIAVEDPEMAAELFTSLVIGRQTRLAILGIEVDRAHLDRRLRAAVALFLDGIRPRPAAES